MVLELKVPKEHHFEALLSMKSIFLCYGLSYIFIGIYWNNHHHTLQIVKSINGKILWSNLHLLFWLSLIPFGTAWMAEDSITSLPVAVYGIILLCCALSYTLFIYTLTNHHGKDSLLSQSIGKDQKGKISILLYIVGIISSFFQPIFGIICYVIVAIIWLIPDQRIEKNFQTPKDFH